LRIRNLSFKFYRILLSGGFCVIIFYKKKLKKPSKYLLILCLYKTFIALAFGKKLCYVGKSFASLPVNLNRLTGYARFSDKLTTEALRAALNYKSVF